jgi:hypothetical protein
LHQFSLGSGQPICPFHCRRRLAGIAFAVPASPLSLRADRRMLKPRTTILKVPGEGGLRTTKGRFVRP